MQQPGQVEMGGMGMVAHAFQDYQRPVGNFTIQGSESQILHYALPKRGQLLFEAGKMRYFSPGITPELRMGNCCAAYCGGESLFRVVYTNEEGPAGNLIGIAPDFNANIIPVSLDVYKDLIISGGAFIAAEDVDLQIKTERIRSLGAACFGGQGLLIHPLQGKGTVFLNASGTIMFRTLRDKEVLYASTGSVVAFQRSVEFTVEMVGGGLKNICCGGQGLFNTKLVGPGLVIIQSLSLEDLRRALAPPMQQNR
jgi:uncharacterized protein (AIM24 family)